MVREDLAADLDKLVASLPKESRTLKRKSLTATSEVEDRTEVSTITTDSVDLEGDVILPDGIDRSYYLRNPCVLLNHEWKTEVGKCRWIRPFENGLKAQSFYPPRPEWYQGTWVPDEVFAAISAGLMQGKSIGYLGSPRRSPTSEELSEHPDWQGAAVVDSAILLEYSVCTVGVNPDCQVGKSLKINWECLGIKPKKKSAYEEYKRLDYDNIAAQELDWFYGKL